MGHASRPRTRTTLARIAVVTMAFSAVGAISALVACSSDPADSTTTTPAPVARESCPVTVKETNGKACKTERLVCTPSFNCPGSLFQQATCTCTNGKFVCNDEVGPVGAAGPQCKPVNGPGGQVCPATAAQASGAACTETFADCRYLGTVCAGRTEPVYDVCYCRPNDNGFAFFCEPAPCSPLPPPREAGAPDAKPEAGPAPADAASGG